MMRPGHEGHPRMNKTWMLKGPLTVISSGRLSDPISAVLPETVRFVSFLGSIALFGFAPATPSLRVAASLVSPRSVRMSGGGGLARFQ